MKMRHQNLALILALLFPSVVSTFGSTEEVLTVPLPGSFPRLNNSFSHQPLAFEPNVGQTDAEVEFLARGPGYQLFLTGSEAVMVLSSPNASEGAKRLGVLQPSAALWDGLGFCENREFTERSNTFESGAGVQQSRTLAHGLDAPSPVESSPGPRHSQVLRMRLVGSNDSPPVQGEVGLTGKVNYFIGNDPSRWRTNIPTFAKVQYREVYPGTDLVYYGNQEGRLEYDFVLAPGADPDLIALEFDGADRIDVDASGDLVAWVGGRPVRWQKPVVYQEFDGRRTEIAGAYRLDDGALAFQADASHRIGFELAAYDRSQPLVIDPVLVYSTYLGGGQSESQEFFGVSTDSQGNAYVVGHTQSPDFPVLNALQSNFAGPGADAFVAKIGPNGERLYATYLGGKSSDGYEWASGVAVDAQGSAYVVGLTGSTNFPMVNPLQANYAGVGDVFIAILNPEGSAITFSSYLGGSSRDAVEIGKNVALDAQGNIYLAGSTYSADFPVQNPWQSFTDSLDGFITKLEAGGKRILYSTFYGGSMVERITNIAVDSNGYAYIAGWTYSLDLPVKNAYQPYFAGAEYARDFFYAKIEPDGTDLVFASYFGGTGYQTFSDLALGPDGSIWLTGEEFSSPGLATPGAYQTEPSPVPSGDGFALGSIVARFDGTNGSLLAATYLDAGSIAAVAVATDGTVFVAGEASGAGNARPRRPLELVNPLQSLHGGYSDGFVAKFSPDLSSLLFSTYFGGSGHDRIHCLALDPSGNLLLAGLTQSSSGFPVVNAFQANYGGGETDAFVAKISFAEVLKISRTGQTVTLSWPASATNYLLEATTSLPAVSWTTVTNTPTVTTNERSVQLPLTGNARFFRLRKP